MVGKKGYRLLKVMNPVGREKKSGKNVVEEQSHTTINSASLISLASED